MHSARHGWLATARRLHLLHGAHQLVDDGCVRRVARLCDLGPLVFLVEHKVQSGLLPDEHRVLAMVDGRIIVKVGVLVAVDLAQEVVHDLLRRDGFELPLWPFVPRCVLLAVVEEAHQLPHLVVVQIDLCLGPL